MKNKSFSCPVCKTVELYIIQKPIDSLRAKNHFENKHKDCRLELKPKENIINFPAKDKTI